MENTLYLSDLSVEEWAAVKSATSPLKVSFNGLFSFAILPVPATGTELHLCHCEKRLNLSDSFAPWVDVEIRDDQNRVLLIRRPCGDLFRNGTKWLRVKVEDADIGALVFTNGLIGVRDKQTEAFVRSRSRPTQ